MALCCATFVTPAAFAEEISDIFVGGTFTHLGSPRLALLSSQQSGWHDPALSATGVRTALISGDYLYLAGDFLTLGSSSRHGLARFAVSPIGTCTLDDAWKPAVTGSVTALACDTKSLFIGGTITAVDGQPRHNLARVNTTDGSAGDWIADTDGTVNALAITGTHLIVGGAFLNVHDQSHVRLARIDTVTAAVAEDFTGAADSDIRAIIISGNKIIIGGQFSRINSEDRLALARLELMSGDVDPKWRADVDGAVLTLSAQTNHLLYVGGSFNSISSLPRANCARIILADGTVDPWISDTNEQVTAIAETHGEQLFLAGHFTRINDASAIGIARVSTQTGIADASWHAPGMLPNTDISALALRDNLLVAAGEAIDGSARGGIATVTNAGNPSAWRVMLGGSQSRALCSVVHEGFRYIGGNFSLFANQPRLNLARISIATGDVDLTWRCDANAPVRAMTVVGNDLVIGGDFTLLGTQPRSYLGKISLADATVSTWDVPADGTILAMAAVGQALVVTGTFQHLGGLHRVGLGRINGDGAVDPTFVADLADLTKGDAPGIGHALAVLPSQQVVVGGRFNAVNGKTVGNCALLNPDTGAMQPWQASADGPVFAIAADRDHVVLGGGFTSIGNESRARLAMVDASTGQPTPWRVDADQEVRTVAIHGDTLWIGGDFSSLNHQPANHLGRCQLSSGAIQPCVGADGRVELATP